MALEFTGMIPTGEVEKIPSIKESANSASYFIFFCVTLTFPVGIPLEKQTAEEFSFYSMQTCHLKTLCSM